MKTLLALGLTFFLTGGAAQALDMTSLSQGVLSDSMEYVQTAEPVAFQLGGDQLTYTAGQLTLDRQRAKAASTGYILTVVLPQRYMEWAQPYFRLNLTAEEWRRLSEINQDFYDPKSPARQALERLVSAWSASYFRGAVPASTITLSDMEPLRRMDNKGSIIYTAGARVSFGTEGFMMPMYSRFYFFREGGELQVMALFTSDGGRYPLIYAADNLVRAAADKGIMEDLGEIMRKNRIAQAKK